MKKLLVFLVVVAVIAFLLVVAGSSLLGKAIVAGVETIGPELTQTTVELEDARLSLFAGRGELKGLVVGNPDGFKTDYAIRLGSVALDLQPMSLLSDKIVVEELVIDGPELIYETKLTSANIGRILKNVESYIGSGKPTEAKPEAASKAFEVRLIKVTNGRVTVASKLLDGEQLVVNLPPIEIRDIGTGPEGATLADVVKRTLASINAETVVAVAQSGQSVGNQIQRSANSLKQKVGGLLDAIKKDKSE